MDDSDSDDESALVHLEGSSDDDEGDDDASEDLWVHILYSYYWDVVW